MPPIGRYGTGRTAVWCISLLPSGRHYAQLSRELSHSGSYAVQFGDSTVLVPSSPAPPALPPSSTRLKFLNIPPPLAKDGLPQALLSAAGYTVRSPSGPVVPPPDGEVLLLQYRLGRDANAAILIVDVLGPTSDPHLHRLPPFMPAHSLPGFMFATLVENDPLPRLPEPRTAPPPSPPPSPPPPQGPAASSDVPASTPPATAPTQPGPYPPAGPALTRGRKPPNLEDIMEEQPSVVSPLRGATMNGISLASWLQAAALRRRAVPVAPAPAPASYPPGSPMACPAPSEPGHAATPPLSPPPSDA